MPGLHPGSFTNMATPQNYPSIKDPLQVNIAIFYCCSPNNIVISMFKKGLLAFLL